MTAKLARDGIVHFKPDVIVVTANGTPVTEGTDLAIAPGVRAVELTVTAASAGGAIGEPPPSSGGPYTYEWTWFALTGCLDAALLSPGSASTRLQWLNPLDRISITLKMAGRFETRALTFVLTSPPNP